MSSSSLWERWGFGPAAVEASAGALAVTPAVLYADVGKRWAPLQCLYYSGDTHTLCSAHPSSSQQEISSYFCPACFDVSSTEDNRCPSCFECPVCGSSLTTTAGKEGYYLRCTHCPWDSLEAGVRGESSQSLTSLLARVLGPPLKGGQAEGQAEGPAEPSLAEKALQSRSAQAAAFSALVEHFSKSPTFHASESVERSGRDQASWQPSDADAMVAAVAVTVPNPTQNSPLYELEPLQQKVVLRAHVACDEAAPPGVGANNGSSSNAMGLKVSLAQRLRNGDPALLHQPALLMLPRRRALFARRERRSVVDVKAGRPGILVMPKVNPLEGDTSSQFKSKKAEWWRKMKSATQYAPRVSIVSALPSRGVIAAGTAVLRLRVSNSRHHKVSVWFASELESTQTNNALPRPLSPQSSSSSSSSSLFRQLGGRTPFSSVKAQVPRGQRREQPSVESGDKGAAEPKAVMMGWLAEQDPSSSLTREALLSAGGGIVLEAVEDFLISDVTSSSGSVDGQQASGGGGPSTTTADGIVERVHKDTAWVQVPLEATPDVSGIVSIALSLAALEYDQEQPDLPPLVIPLLVSFPIVD